MMKTPDCNSFPIDSLLKNEADTQLQTAFEEHLETCRECQTRLTGVAANDDWWDAAANHLSSANQIEIPNSIRSKLSQVSDFIAPTLDDRYEAETVSAKHLDWQRILDPPTHPEMLGRIDHFEIEGKIGSGGMGIVLKGFDRHLNRAVAIKILAPHLASNGTSRKRFAREAQAAAAVVHPNVIPIYAVNSSESRPYIVMQLVSGHSLQSLVQERGPLDFKEIVRIAIQIADGLAAAHQQGLIHRDIKPANILIEHDVSRVVITDFGLARAADDAGMTQTGWIAGTPHYMSPEQSRGENLDSRSDLFSLGGLMYFLATGREPFRGEKPLAVIQKILTEQPESPQSLNNDIPIMLSDIIEKLLEKKPADRFQSANVLQDLLQRYLTYLQQPLQTSHPPRVVTRRRSRARNKQAALVAVAATLLAVAVCWFGWYVNQTNDRPFSDSTVVNSRDFETTMESMEPVPDLASYFSDDRYAQEYDDVHRQLEQMENQIEDFQPFGSTTDSYSTERLNGFSDALSELQKTAAELERTEQQQTAAIKKILENSKNQPNN